MTKRVNIRLPQEMVEAIDEYKKKNPHFNLSDAVRDLLLAGMKSKGVI